MSEILEEKRLSIDWEEKTNTMYLPLHIANAMDQFESYINDCNRALGEAGEPSLGYTSQEGNIDSFFEDYTTILQYVSELRCGLEALIDKPLFDGFNKGATEVLSNIKLDKYATENLAEVKNKYEYTIAYSGVTQTNYMEKPEVKFEDFIADIDMSGNTHSQSVGEIRSQFADDYNALKEAGALEGSDIKSLSDYLDSIQEQGEFAHTMHQPGKAFLRGLIHLIPVVPAAIELIRGEELITGEDLTELETSMNVVSIALDVFVITKAIDVVGDMIKSGKALGLGNRAIAKEVLKLSAKSMLVDVMGYTSAYTVGVVAGKMNLPPAVQFLLMMGTGLTVSHVAGKYLIKNPYGDIVEVFDSVGNKSTLDEFTKRMDELPHAKINPDDFELEFNAPRGAKSTDVSDYMLQADIDTHLSLFDEGVVKIQSEKEFNKSIADWGSSIGDPNTGTFVSPKWVIEDAIEASGGDPRKLEILLGFENGYLGESPILIEVLEPSDIRMPTGNEAGAWEGLWKPGGYTDGNVPEAVINQITPDNYVVSSINKVGE